MIYAAEDAPHDVSQRWAGTAKPAIFGFDLIIVLAATVLFVGGAGLFAAHQSIWVDETTQMSGLALPFNQLYAWLIGTSDVMLGVPPDRMPPLSYTLGQLWADIFGLSETWMRYFGIAAVVAAVPAIYLAGRTVGGPTGGAFASAVILSSPATMVLAPEIRAYPLLFCFSAWASWSFARLIVRSGGSNSDRRDLILLCMFLILAGYTHFFGIVLAGSLFLGLFIDRLVTRRNPLPVLIAGATTLVAFGGLVPFIAHAVAMSADPAPAPDQTGHGALGAFLDTARLGFRLIFSPILLGTPVALVLAAVAVTGLLVIAIWVDKPWHQGRGPKRSILLALLLPVAAALCCLGVLRLFISSFDVLAPNYNVWMVPLVTLAPAIAARVIASRRLLKILVFILMAIAPAANLVGASMLVRNPELYSHGPAKWLMRQIPKPDETLVIYDRTDPWGQIYFPLFFLSHGQVEQWLQDADGALQRITETGIEPIPNAQTALERFSSVLRVKATFLDSAALASIAAGRKTCSDTLGAGRAADGSSFCAMVSVLVLPADRQEILGAEPSEAGDK